ncbi:MAG: conjugal transfer protein TrbL family protein, partial [Anaerotignaceae bacterium]
MIFLFIWDFILGDVMDQLIDWLYGNIVGFLGDFFAQMGN